MKSILDPWSRYTSSVETGLRKTFARIRRRQREAGEGSTQQTVESPTNVLPLDLKKTGNGKFQKLA